METETNESVFSPYKTFTYKFEDGTTFTIGLLGFENMNNANWDVASHYEGLHVRPSRQHRKVLCL